MGQRSLVVFSLGNEDFGLDISKVQEILRIPQITKIPEMPDYVEGVINLRGNVIPVIDLYRKFSMDKNRESHEQRLLVINVEGAMISIMVDDVTEVLSIDEVDISILSIDSSYSGGNWKHEIGRSGEKLLQLIDMKDILTGSPVLQMKN